MLLAPVLYPRVSSAPSCPPPPLYVFPQSLLRLAVLILYGVIEVLYMIHVKPFRHTPFDPTKTLCSVCSQPRKPYTEIPDAIDVIVLLTSDNGHCTALNTLVLWVQQVLHN